MFIPFKLSVIASDCILFHALLLLCCASAVFLLVAVTFFQGPSLSFDSDGSQRLHCKFASEIFNFNALPLLPPMANGTKKIFQFLTLRVCNGKETE